MIGGGSAGLGAARAARARGASVLLVEKDRIGGDCTFTGCVPSKTLLEATARGDTFADARARVHEAVATIAATETADVLRSEGIDVVQGEARFVGPGHLVVDDRPLTTRRVILATGARPAVPPVVGLDCVPFLTNESLFELTELPPSLAVLGGGPVGVEMAQAFGRLGSAVTLIEMVDRVLPNEEPLASQVVADVLTREGVTLQTASAVTRATSQRGEIVLDLADGSSVTTSALLVAVGRRPASDALGLEAAGVALDAQGFVRVDDRLRTSARGVYAAGDVAQTLQFTHVAYETGRLAALNALSRIPLHRFRSSAVPWVTFTDPEVARVGLTEAEAAGRGGRVAFLPLDEVDRAVAAGRTEGFIQLLAGPRPLLRGIAGGRILGATVVAPRAGEMIHEVVLALRTGMFPARLAATTHAYPTWSMAIQQAAAQFFGTFGGRTARLAGGPTSGGSIDPATGFPG